MALLNETYKLNEPKVVSETLDGEAVTINLETGRYYSMNPSGSAIWELVLAGHPIPEIIEKISGRYDADTDVVRKSVTDFIARLSGAELITESDTVNETAAPEWDGAKESFAAPAIEEFDDMEEMLLADPIHDVTPAGWPHRN